MDDRTERGTPPAEGMPGVPEGSAALPGAPRKERKRRKVSLIVALVVNVVTVLVVAIVIVAILLPGYRRSFTAAKAVKGADRVWVVVLTSESNVRANETDFTRAQDGLRNALQELVGTSGDNVYAYVRDNYPTRAWIEENLPEDLRRWLEELYPKAEEEKQDQARQDKESVEQEVKP